MLDLSVGNSEWLSQVDLGAMFPLLLNQLGGAHFFIKDSSGRFQYANEAAVRAYGYLKLEDVLGRTDFDLFSRNLAQSYAEADKKILEGEGPIINMPELVPDRVGRIRWAHTSKVRLCNRDGEIIGLAGTCVSHENSRLNLMPQLDITPALDYINVHYAEKISVEHLASLCGQSLRTFERSFDKAFQTSPQNYWTKTRIYQACQLMMRSRFSLSEIASRCGFYDQSSFTRAFKTHTGNTPGQYRKQCLP